MHEYRVASRYAKSLLELANERGELEQVEKDMEFFNNVCEENPMLVRVLRNPIINHGKKIAIIEKLLKGKVGELTFSMFYIISRKNREAYLSFIAKEFITQYKIFKGIATADVTTTSPLTEAQRTSFINMVASSTGKKVDLTEKVDQSIIGGFVLRIGDRMVDQSVKSQLSKLKSKFKDNPYIPKY